MGRPVDHHLLPLERRVEVRRHADAPPVRAVAEPKRLRRRLFLVPPTERATRVCVIRGACRSRPARAPGRDRHPATGRRVVAEVGQRRSPAQDSDWLPTAVNAFSISIGIGNAIVVDGVAPISRSVCR